VTEQPRIQPVTQNPPSGTETASVPAQDQAAPAAQDLVIPVSEQAEASEEEEPTCWAHLKIELQTVYLSDF
jgi:hypothetical protein